MNLINTFILSTKKRKQVNRVQIFNLITKRYYPGLSNLLNNTSLIALKSTPLFRAKHLITYRQHILQRQDNSKIYLVSIEGLIETTLKTPIPIIVKPSIFCYDPNKIKQQLNNNYILKKYLPEYEKHDIEIPYIIETFPNKGISGSYTISPKELELLNNNNPELIEKHALILGRYLHILYGGSPMRNILDIVKRVDLLFLKGNIDGTYSNLMYSDLIPITQHWLSLDTWNLLLAKKEIEYEKNINISAKTISLQKHLEITTLSRTHDFLCKNELKILDSENINDIQFLNENSKEIQLIVKQPYPDAISTIAVGITPKVLYPIDVKLIANPEKNLDMLSSYSSLSVDLKSNLIADKIKGQYSVLQNKLLDLEEKKYLQEHFKSLDYIRQKLKTNKITNKEFTKLFHEWNIHFIESQLKRGSLLYNNTSFMPSIITEILTSNNNEYLDYLMENPLYYKNFIKDLQTSIKFPRYFPNMKEYKTLDMYDINLSILIILKKYGYLENYYAVRKLLIIKDVTDD